MRCIRQKGGTRIPTEGSVLQFEQSDRSRYRQAGEYTPSHIGRLLDAANEGDIEQLAVAAREIQERNWEVILAMQVRKCALTGLEWTTSPGDGRETSKTAAEQFANELRSCGADGVFGSFHCLLNTLMDAVVSPLAAAEIVWGPGGRLEGFRPIGAWHFTYRDSLTPKLVTAESPEGEELPPAKFVTHRFGCGDDPARAGLIRTLIWLHAFQNYPMKDLVSFVERYGMPFIVAKVDRNTWDNERNVLRKLIRSFGPGGGGVFTKNTELELLQSASGGGDVYFKLLDYTSRAITKTILGQLASTSDSSGLSGGDAQTKVRRDLLESDARSLETTIRNQIAIPWTRFNYGESAAAPVLRFQTEEKPDGEAFAATLVRLNEAGFEAADVDEISARFGLKLRKREERSAHA